MERYYGCSIVPSIISLSAAACEIVCRTCCKPFGSRMADMSHSFLLLRHCRVLEHLGQEISSIMSDEDTLNREEIQKLRELKRVLHGSTSLFVRINRQS